jgi:hypothetical protein
MFISDIESNILSKINNHDMDLDVEEIYSLAIKIMKLVEKTHLPGTTKKEIAINTLKRIVSSSDKLSIKQKESLLYIIENQLPFIINALVWVANNNINLKKLGKSCTRYCF